jgi:hypothetical protein
MHVPSTYPSQDPRGGASQLRSLCILHTAMAGGVVVYLTLSYFLIYYSGKPLLIFEDILYLVLEYGTIGFSVFCLAISTILFKKKLGVIATLDLPAKFSGYREAFIIRMALLEGPAFFCVVCFMLTSRWIFTAEALVLLSIMIYLRPGLNRVAEELNLNPNEISWLQSE